MRQLCIFLCLSFLFSVANAQLSVPAYQKGNALLTGTIANYDPKDNLEIKIGAPNILMGASETLFPTIEPDGTFKVYIPIYHSTQVRMIIGKEDLVILMNPDKETKVDINLNNQPGKRFVFSGEYGVFNNEWNQPELIKNIPPIYSDGNQLDSIVDMSANEFKKRCIDQYKQITARNNVLQQFNEDVRTLANLSCAFDCLLNLQAAHYCLQTAYQKKNGITREQAFTAFANIPLPDDFHDYLKDFPVNHPLALYCYNYRNVLMTFYETHKDPLALDNYLLANAPLTKEEQSLIRQYETAFKTGVAFQQHTDLMAITLKYAKEADEYRWKLFSNTKERLNHVMQDSTCLFLDYLRTINIRGSFHNLMPLNTLQNNIVCEITNPILLGIIQDMNQQMRPRQEAGPKKFTVRETPQVPKEELLAALISRNKGKVQFIDFWATWCGGCRQIIKEYEPLKVEMDENKVAFVYLTGPSSTKKTWDILIKNIAGEHYWLDNEQWSFLWQHFQMTGLPMYLVIDKEGNIVKQFTHITVKELKDVLKQEIEKE